MTLEIVVAAAAACIAAACFYCSQVQRRIASLGRDVELLHLEVRLLKQLQNKTTEALLRQHAYIGTVAARTEQVAARLEDEASKWGTCG